MNRFADLIPTDEERARFAGREFFAIDHPARGTVKAWSSPGYFDNGWFVAAGGTRSLGVYRPESARRATAEEVEDFIKTDVGYERERLEREARDNAILAKLGLTTGSFYRFRGVYEDGDKIVVSTRGGGGNRECYCHEWAKPEERTDTTCGDPHHPACVRVFQRALRQHPLYLFDEDDDGDCTYADFYFRKPEGGE